ncbi:MAG TPA: methionyl-tRNA formyltransferase [Candidatus Paceibacterota bacterium]|nr:methionyl-tRNA formyltransferase [Candidatus Paceibacterota bacterium]
MNKLNFAFFGTPEVASETLQILKENGYLPSLIVTSIDKPKGRKLIMTPPPAKLWAIENNIPYIQPEKISEQTFDQYDLFIVVAYGKILPERIINAPRLGSINIHYSLLPKYRGASPVESAILNGEKVTGVTIQQMAYEMDSGPILARETTEIDPEETAPSLRKRLIELGGNLLVKILPDLVEQKISPSSQNEADATFCKKIKKEDGQIDPALDPTLNYNKFRAYAEWPRTFFFKDGKRIIITKAKLENGLFVIEKVIPEGGKEKDYTL